MNYDVINSVIIIDMQLVVIKLAKLVRYFFIFHIRPNLRSNFGNHTRLERVKKILCISEIFGSRGGGIEILTMIGVQNANF